MVVITKTFENCTFLEEAEIERYSEPSISVSDVTQDLMKKQIGKKLVWSLDYRNLSADCFERPDKVVDSSVCR